MYSYEAERSFVFTESGQVMLLKIRDTAKRLLAQSDAVTLRSLIIDCSGDTWTMMACVDRLVELGELRCVHDKGAMHERVYVRGFNA